MKQIYLTLLGCILVVASMAQINYTFSPSSGTYTAITGTAVTFTPTGYDGGAGGLDEGYANAIPIGFNFTYNNAATAFTTVGVTSNGFLYLGSTNFSNTSTFYTNNLASGFSPQRPIIAPLWDDYLIGGAQYSTTGSAPNRVFTMQWDNINWNYSATSPAMSMQVKLFEGTNVIQFIYNNLGGTVVSGSGSIGITATGTGSGNYLSLSASSASPTASSTVETNTISTAPANNQVYTFTPVPQPANDFAVDVAYALGKAGKGTLGFVRAYIKNLGTNAGTNVPVTLTVTGANSYTQTITVPSFPSGAAGFVSFSGFLEANTGTNNISVSVGSDDVNGNNSAVTTQEVTINELSYAVGSTISSGVNAGAGNEVAVKLATPYPNSVSQINAYFNAAGNGYDVAIYPNVAGLPGPTPLYTQTGLTSTLGLNTIILPSAVNTPDTFYVAFKQTGAALAFGYQTETPLRQNAFFLKSGVNPWFDLSGNAANTFRLMAGVTTGAALPVKLTSFVGEQKKDMNNLYWNTATEMNNAGFYVERSADGKSFSSLKFVASKAEGGNSATSLSYSFVDANPLGGNNYYRLKQTDKDGRFVYSDIIVLKSSASDIRLSNIFPNPTRNELNVVITAPSAQRASIVVTDLTGKIISQRTTQLIAGDNLQQLNLQSLASGNYILKVVCNNGCELAAQRFVKQ